MKRALFLCLLACACDAVTGDECADDPGARHHAVNPATGACWEFASSCEVPSAWADCTDGCPPLECPPDYIPDQAACMCVPIGQCTGCIGDQDCDVTQHCDLEMPPMCTMDGSGGALVDQAPQGTCVDNRSCSFDEDCDEGQWCDTGDAECDPLIPGCGVPAGICTRGTRPTAGTCILSTDCGAGEVCPAEYGYCGLVPHAEDPSVPVCEAYCESVCWSDADCAPEDYCNVSDGLCVYPNPGSGGVPDAACGGWCVAR